MPLPRVARVPQPRYKSNRMRRRSSTSSRTGKDTAPQRLSRRSLLMLRTASHMRKEVFFKPPFGRSNADMPRDAARSRGEQDDNDQPGLPLIECAHGDDEDRAASKLLAAACGIGVREPDFTTFRKDILGHD